MKHKTTFVEVRHISLGSKMEEKKYGISILIQLLFMVLFTAGIVFAFITNFDLPVISNKIVATIVIIVLIGYFMFFMPKLLKFILPIGTGLYGYAIYLFWEELLQGFYYIENYFISYYNKYYNMKLYYYLVKEDDPTKVLTLFFIFASILLSFLVVLVFLAERGKALLGFFVILVIGSGLFVGQLPNVVSFFFSIFGFISLFINTSKMQLDKKKGALSFYNKMMLKRHITQALLVILFLTLGISFMIIPPSKYEKQEKIAQLKETLQTSLRTISLKNIIPSNFFFLEIAPIFEMTGGMSNGTFMKKGEVTYDHKTDLILTLPEELNIPIYLKGYIGSVYTENGWKSLSKEYEQEYEQLEQLFQKEGYSIENIDQITQQLFQKNHLSYLSYVNFEGYLKNIDAGYQEFLPYGSFNLYLLKRNGLLRSRKNTRIQKEYKIDAISIQSEDLYSYSTKLQEAMKSEREYLEQLVTMPLEEYMETEYKEHPYELVNDYYYGNYANKVEEEKRLSIGELKGYWYENFQMGKVVQNYLERENYLTLLKQYNEFVQKVYLDVPEDLKEDLLQLFDENNIFLNNNFSDLTSSVYIKNRGNNNRKTIDTIESFFENNTEYSLNPGAVPEGEDFVKYFLFKNRKGYCVHYASAAVLWYRAMGIPARYVEGYVVTREDIFRGQPIEQTSKVSYGTGDTLTKEVQDSVEIEIPDDNAHAWVEIYLEDYGWVMVEVTKGYQSNYGDALMIPDAIRQYGMENTTSISNVEKEESKTTPSLEPTEIPQASKNPIKETNKKGIEKKGKLSDDLKKVVKLILVSMIIFAIVISLIFMRYQFIWNRREKRLNKSEEREKVLLYYKQMKQLLLFEKIIRKNGMTTKEFCLFICEREQLEQKQAEEIEIVLNLVQKVTFSNLAINRLESEQIKKTIIWYRTFVYQKYNVWIGLYMKYIRLL